jgi:hypothetical protein
MSFDFYRLLLSAQARAILTDTRRSGYRGRLNAATTTVALSSSLGEVLQERNGGKGEWPGLRGKRTRRCAWLAQPRAVILQVV